VLIDRITKQFEGGSIKCGNYWEESKYGPIRINQISQTGGDDQTQTATTGFDFGMAASTPKTADTEQASHIKRVFEVTHDNHPEASPRKIVQIQCVSWPDFDVPESADVLLDLIRDVDEAFGEIYGTVKNLDRQEEPPVLVHCELIIRPSSHGLMAGSAGVGRTGSFIMVDSILDGLRRERNLPPPAQALKGTDSDIEPPRPVSSSDSSGEALPNPVSLLERSGMISTPIPEEVETEPLAAPVPKRMSLSHANMVDHQRQSLMQHRGNHPGPGSANSTQSHLGSGGQSYTSSENKSFNKIVSEGYTSLSVPFPFWRTVLIPSSGTERDMRATTVLEILEGIRVQRMSLVQSLRQFVFVHRGQSTLAIFRRQGD
jgi:protein tyrosine phosphatase